MAKIKGTNVVLVKKTKNGTDPFGNPIFRDTEIQIKNVLIAPVSTKDIIDNLNLTGKTAVYTLAIPKGDNNNWEDVEVRFFGQKWKTFGFTTEGIEELIPLSWNKKVMVERYEY